MLTAVVTALEAHPVVDILTLPPDACFGLIALTAGLCAAGKVGGRARRAGGNRPVKAYSAGPAPAAASAIPFFLAPGARLALAGSPVRAAVDPAGAFPLDRRTS